MAYAAIGFGKNAHRTLPEVFFIDPNYFFWAVKGNILRGVLALEMKEMLRKLRRVRIPSHLGNGLAADHVHRDGKFVGLVVVPSDYSGTYPTGEAIRLPYIDLGFVHENMPDDTKGNMILLSTYLGFRQDAYDTAIPGGYFCEAFFNDPKNFV